MFVIFLLDCQGLHKKIEAFFSRFRTLLKLVPGFLQFRILRNVEYVKAVTSSPDVNSLRDRLKKLIEEKKV